MTDRFLKLSEVSAPNGIISGLAMTVTGEALSVSVGIWRINNTLYQTSAATNLTLAAPDVIDNRLDLVYADETNGVYVLTGSVSQNPELPALPANAIQVGFILVTPAGSTSNSAPTATYVTMAEFNAIVGDMSQLATINTNTLVDSINSVFETVNGINQDNVILKIFKKANYS